MAASAVVLGSLQAMPFACTADHYNFDHNTLPVLQAGTA